MHRHHHLFHCFPRSKRDLCVIRYLNIFAAADGDDDNAFVNDQLVLILKLDYYYNYLLSSWLYF